MHAKLLYAALLSLALAGTGPAQSPDDRGYSDPRFPGEAPLPANHLLDRVKTLEKRERELTRRLEQLPPLESKIAPSHQYFGYLSRQQPGSATNDAWAAWVDLSFFGKWTASVDGIALVPAYYPAFSAEENYGFPKRFRIEVFSHQAPEVPVTVADWTAMDFPDPGLHPVFFSFPPSDVQTVRLTVTRGATEGTSQFFAMDELMVFQQGNNVAPPAYQRLSASDSYEYPPYWKLQYLTNRKIHIGDYFHTAHDVDDFVQYFDPETLRAGHPQILIDLGAVRPVGRVELYPAILSGTPIPEFAFPLKYRVELLKQPDDDKAVLSRIVEDTLPSRMRWHALSSAKGRFVRITLLELPLRNERPVFAMGEIRVIGRQGGQVENFADGKKITTVHFPEDELADTGLLVDGFSNGRKIIQERLYIQQLAERKMVEQELAQTRERLLIARATRTSRLWMSGISGGTILFFALVFWIALQRTLRQKALLRLRQQIAADLHDDISSNLGTISMITQRLQQDASPSLVKQKLTEIGHLAQESFVSVKEIIWHMDSDIVYLSEMLDQIEKTARSILSCRVDCRFPTPKGIPIPARIRRNIMLLVKEVLYNCAKYAGARSMLIRADVRNAVLELSMKDDGCGFDPACATVADSESGRGLTNMKRRARLLGAGLDIHSAPGQGTEVTLKMPLK